MRFTPAIILGMVAALAIPSLPALAQSTPQQPNASEPQRVVNKERISGDNRYATAIAVTESLFRDQSVDTVYIASGRTYPDAISVTSLVGQRPEKKTVDAVLLSPRDGLSPEVLSEAKRLLKPTGTVRIVGGTQALSPNVQTQIEKLLPDAKVKRIAGPTRVETALAIADELRSSSQVSEVVITPADQYGVSMVATSLTAKRHAAQVVSQSTKDGSVHPALTSWLNAVKPKKVTVIGPRGFASQLAYGQMERITDDNPASVPWQTCKPFPSTCINDPIPPGSPAQVIAEKLLQVEFPKAKNQIVVSLTSEVDGLAAGQVAQAKASPIVPIEIEKPMAAGRYGYLHAQLKNTNLLTLWAIGGEQVVPSSVLDQIKQRFEG